MRVKGAHGLLGGWGVLASLRADGEAARDVGPAALCDVLAPFARDGPTGKWGAALPGGHNNRWEKQSHKREEENGELLSWPVKAGEATL